MLPRPEDRRPSGWRPICGATDKASTEPALRFAKAMIDVEAPTGILAAGGANAWTGPLAQDLRIPVAGIGMGSFARSIMKAKIGAPPSDEAVIDDVRRARRLVSTVEPESEV